MELKIDQQKYFAFKVEDIDTAQANINLLDRSLERASYALRDVIDQRLLLKKLTTTWSRCLWHWMKRTFPSLADGSSFRPGCMACCRKTSASCLPALCRLKVV